MKNSAVVATLFGFAWFVFLPANAHAAIAKAESMEWVLANSDSVVVGKVIKVEKVTGSDKKVYELATVAVSKTLKGVHAGRQTFLLQHYHPRYAQQWKEEGIPILLCLVKNDGKVAPFPAEKIAWVLRDDGNHPDSVLLGKSKHEWPGSMPVLTCDFEVLAEPNAILTFVEQTVKGMAIDRPLKRHVLDVPYGTAVHKELYSRSAVWLVVPIDSKLQVLGGKWCKSANPGERREGARILRHFKNEMNIAILKSLLEDPSTAESRMHRTVPGKGFILIYWKKLYYVRQTAFDALRQLGVTVKKPVLEELLEGIDEPSPNMDIRDR